MLEHLGEQNEPGAETFRLDALEAVNQQEAWWDDGRDPSAFLHGVTIIGKLDQLPGRPAGFACPRQDELFPELESEGR